jgi:polyphosphate glucokinase
MAQGNEVRTLSIDIGGSGLKAAVLDTGGEMLTDRARVETRYPCTPPSLFDQLVGLVEPLKPYDRVSAGFPGMVRSGRILSAPHFETEAGPGTKISKDHQRLWRGFDFAAALADALGAPAKVVNDADMQGLAVISGTGLEMVITLGTGFGTALFHDGRLAPHLEIAHHPFRKGETYNEQLGNLARKQIGDKHWSTRVEIAIDTLQSLTFFDRLYIGGGNAKKITIDLPDDVEIVPNTAGITGGVKLWDGSAGV